MSFILNKLFPIWLLLLPFSWVAAAYMPIVAPDKLLAPVLIIMGAIATLRVSGARLSRISIYVLLAVIFIIVKHISYASNNEIFLALLWDDLIKVGYFLLPLLMITRMEQFHRAGWIITLVAVIGCLSAFFVSVGLITLPVERFEASRLGVESLRKAIGFFTSYGDLAQYLSFAVLWVIVAPGLHGGKSELLRSMRLLVTVSVVLGLLGTQSRNIFLSLLTAVSFIWFLKWLRKVNPSARATIELGVLGFVIVLVGVLIVFSADIISGMSRIGGESAINTANVRLEQYLIAWKEIISVSPVFGANLKTYMQWAPFIEGIHNVWIRLAAHGGLLSVLIMLVLLVRIYMGIRVARQLTAKLDEAMVATGYFAAMMVSVMFYVGMGELFWALLGVVASLTCIEPLTATAQKTESAATPSASLSGDGQILARRRERSHLPNKKEPQ